MGRQWDKKINAEEGIGTEEAFLKELESCASFHGVRVLMWKHFSVVEDNREHFMVEDRKTGKRYQLIYLTPKNTLSRWECRMQEGEDGNEKFSGIRRKRRVNLQCRRYLRCSIKFPQGSNRGFPCGNLCLFRK